MILTDIGSYYLHLDKEGIHETTKKDKIVRNFMNKQFFFSNSSFFLRFP